MSNFSWPTVGSGVVITLIASVVLALLLAAFKHWFGQIKKQLVPNGGASLRDAVNRIETAQKESTAMSIAHGLQLAVVTTRLDEHIRVVRERDVTALAQAAAVALQAHDERASNTREIIANTGTTP